MNRFIRWFKEKRSALRPIGRISERIIGNKINEKAKEEIVKAVEQIVKND